MHVLDKIVLQKQREVDFRKENVPTQLLEAKPYFNSTNRSLHSALTKKDSSCIIAEFKRKSPSKSDINLTADPEHVASGYQRAGASAISILTDTHFFGGSDHYVGRVRIAEPRLPILRKEFIIDEYQIIESKAIGADAILLIAEILTINQVKQFSNFARSIGLDVLLELHSQDQVEKWCPDVSLIGVNNRDLTTFEVDYERSKRLYDILPEEFPKVAESGLHDALTLANLYQHGFRGFLIGEHFMRQEDPGKACKKMIDEFVALRSLNHGKI